ncbi:Cell division protein FtsL [compost metagenome]
MAYTRGNLAVKEKRKQAYSPERYRETTKVVTRKTTIPAREKLLYLFTIVLCVTVMVGLLLQNSTLYGMKREMFNMNAQIKQTNLEISQHATTKETLEQQIPEEAAKLGYVEPLDEGVNIAVPDTAAVTP